MADLDLKQSVKVALPKTAKGYIVPVTEWEYIKNKVTQISNEPNIYLILASAFLGAFLSSLAYSLTGDFPSKGDGSISISFVVSWAFVILSGIVAALCFFFGKKFTKIDKIQSSYILEQMNIIEARFKKEETKEHPSTIETIFYDTFDTDLGWNPYLEGKVALTDEITPRNGKFCLKKYHKNDPHGGYKKIGKTIGLGFIFSGWIYRPSNKPGGKGDRLAIEDSSFSGYGFSIAHGNKFASIERRDKGGATTISPKMRFNPPLDNWYYFEFHTSDEGKFALYISNPAGDRILSLSAIDSTYSKFDRITIHGGQPYYIDEIKIITTG